MANLLRVALVQHACAASRDSNLSRTAEGIRKAARRGARLVLLEELHATRYFCQQENVQGFDKAEPIPGPTTDSLGEIARELNIVIVASIFERRAAGLYHNTAVAIEADGTIAGRYRKMHIPDDPGYYEKFYFAPGDIGFKPIQTSVGRLGVLVCWDQWYPEAARLMALAGADMLLYPTAIGFSADDNAHEQTRQRDAWITVQRGHAIANGLAVLACNRTGFEPDPANSNRGVHFWGSSFICGPQGEMLAQSPAEQADILVADIDPARPEQVRRIWPYFRDRRIDAYGDLSRRFLD
jgi:N-carbamoylputrescine amidase